MTDCYGFGASRVAELAVGVWLVSFLGCGAEPKAEQNEGSAAGNEPLPAGYVSPGGVAGGGLSGLVAECAALEMTCDGDVAVPCDPNSGTRRDCGAEGFSCRSPNGCVVCTPGEGTCEGNRARHCNAAGTGYEEFECDPLQAMVCEAGGCTGACSPAVLQDGYVGCDYYPTVTANPVFAGFQFAVAVANAGQSETTVQVTRGGESIASETIAPGQLRTIALPWVSELKGGDQNSCQAPPGAMATSLVKDGAYRLRATGPVSVYQFNPLQYQLDPIPETCPLRNDCPGAPLRPDEGCLSFSNDATLLFPVNVLTASYSVMSWPSTSVGQGFASVVATENGTEVRVRGRGTFVAGAGIDSAGSGVVVLDRGDVLQLLAEPAATQVFGSDLSGTVISASAPIQVIGGSSCAHVPEAITNACDHMEHAMLPEETLGKDYVLSFPAIPGSEVPQVIRILPTVANTTIRFEPELPGVGSQVVRSPEQGPLELSSVKTDFRVVADNPILVVHYLQGQASADGAGDPAMAVSVPVQQYRNDYIFSVSSTYDYNFINVVALEGTTVQLNGEELPSSSFSSIGTSPFGVQRVSLPQGEEIFHIEGDQPFGVVVYGYGKFTSYLYPGGLDLKKISPPILR